MSLARTVTLSVVTALVLWRAMRWIHRHVAMLQASAPRTHFRTIPVTRTNERGTQERLPFPPIEVETIQSEIPRLIPAPPSGEAAVFSWLEESLSIEEEVEVQKTETPCEPEPLHIDEENNADPIDGMLLLPGETTVRCTCGLVYRVESVQWLEEQFGGECVQCHARVRTPVRRS
jgi:hypothetical protein